MDNQQLLDDFINLRGEGREIYNSVFRFVEKYLGNRDDAEYVMTDIQVKAWRKKGIYDSKRTLNPWLFSLATNTCIDFQRKNKRNRRMMRLNEFATKDFGEHNSEGLEDSYVAPSDLLSLEESKNRIKGCVDKLPYKQRLIISMVYFGGLKYREAAELLDIPVGTVKSRLNSGLKKLEELFITDKKSAA
jgi:RNA polymerase sigma-70 factor, ECF subfamily